jgi:hypothetical protein
MLQISGPFSTDKTRQLVRTGFAIPAITSWD